MERWSSSSSRPSEHASPASREPTTSSPRRRRRNRCRRKKTSRSSTAVNIDGDQCRRKLFVGQLPSQISKRQLRLLFAKFGRIVQLKIRTDRETGDHYGLVTYATARSAEIARTSLHNVVQLPETRRPLQVNFIDHLANYRQRKLFVGRISTHLTENDLITMFASFGDIENCAIIKQPHTGLSAGCAFVTFTEKASAAAAICCLHRSQVMGWTSSMVVKLADTRQTKLLKRLDQFIRPPNKSTCMPS